MSDEAKILVCQAANADLTVLGSTFTRQCSACSTRVMVAPSGERLLEREPNILVLCTLCAEARLIKRLEAGEEFSVAPAASPAELAREMTRAVPNANATFCPHITGKRGRN